MALRIQRTIAIDGFKYLLQNKISAIYSNGFKFAPTYDEINRDDKPEFSEKNIIYLAGMVASQISYKTIDGRIECASTELAVKVYKPSPDVMHIYLKFGRELAEIAAEHVQKFDTIYISGQISEVGEVHVGRLNFLGNPTYEHFELVRRAKENIDTKKVDIMDEFNKHGSFLSMESSWESLFSTPYKWYDLRIKKKTMNTPDFRHIDTKEGLWIASHKNSSWVKSKLTSLGKEAFASCSTKENLWQTFFADPSEWFDYRKMKKSSQLPDFVQKDTYKLLWAVDRRNPEWVTPMLSTLQDDAFASFPSKEHLWKLFFADPSKWFDNRKVKRSNEYPDFMHKDIGEALWIEDVKTPSWVKSMLNNLQDGTFPLSSFIEYQWKTLFADPSKWFDDRKIKKSSKHPDFVHKVTLHGLWIESFQTPAWVRPMLSSLQVEAFRSSQSNDDRWKKYFVDPSKWFDNRKTKKSDTSPDFRHKNTGEPLWIVNERTPAWVLPMLNNLQNESVTIYSCTEDLWKTLLADPSKWLDSRKAKKSSKHPDFIHVDTCKALWIKSKITPAWVLHKLNDIQDEEFASSHEVLASPSKWLDS